MADEATKDNLYTLPQSYVVDEWINITGVWMRKELYKEIRDPHMFFNEQTGKEEYVITQTSLLTLQALVLGKHASRSELNSFGFSLLLN